MPLLQLTLLCAAVAGTPLLLAFRFSRRREPGRIAINAGILAVCIPLATALALHTASIPITPVSLSLAHLTLFASTLVITRPWRFSRRFRSRTLPPPSTPFPFPLSAFCVLLFVILFPFTRFTGIDTYKWQDLATAVRMEQCIPWIVHPLSLLGFTPRAYPPAHPVLLATVQMIGGLGVDGGFAVISFFTALLGLTAAMRLANAMLPPHLTGAAALLYVLSPVFIRYAHWATGRGLFLAILPVFLALLIEPLSSAPPTPAPASVRIGALLRRVLAITGIAILLLLTHKVALVAVPLCLLCTAIAALIPPRLPRLVPWLVSLPFIAVAAAVATPALLPAPAGILAGLVHTGTLRFAWMLPFSLIGLWTAARTAPPWRRSLPAALCAIPLAFERQMYGALIALPFVCMFAVAGFQSFTARMPAYVRIWGIRILAIVTLLGAVTTVWVRSQIACTPALYRAAQFLETHDPCGPFMLHTPGITRSRIQAYVSGCPRFTIHAGETVRMQWTPRPRAQATLRATMDAWSATLRHFIAVSDIAIDWYGHPRAHYHFIIDGQGTAPPGAVLIYDREGIRIYETPGSGNGA